jgi:DnaJ-class molecular chaperone
MSGTIICPNCNGNGYVGNSKEENQQDDCITCKNQGKIALTDETIWITRNNEKYTSSKKKRSIN